MLPKMRLPGDGVVFCGWKWMVLCGAVALCLPTPSLRAQSGTDTEASFRLFPLHSFTDNYQANDVQTTLRNLLPRAKIYYDTTANALAVYADPQQMRLIETVVTALDKPRAIYRLTYTLTETAANGTTKTEHETVMLTAHAETVLRQGVRVPLVTGTTEKNDTSTRIQYIDLGLRIEASLEGMGREVQLRSKIERSSIADQKSTVPPDPAIRQVTLDERSPLVEGKNISIGTLDLADGRMEISVKAEAIP